MTNFKEKIAMKNYLGTHVLHLHIKGLKSTASKVVNVKKSKKRPCARLHLSQETSDQVLELQFESNDCCCSCYDTFDIFVLLSGVN